MKNRHNKKRNSLFLFEALNVELTKTVLENNSERKNQIIAILKEFFHKGSILGQEIRILNDLIELRAVDQLTAEKILIESKVEYHQKLSKSNIFESQTKLVNRINKVLGSGLYSNFVGNYKNLATIAQIFNFEIPAKERVLLENQLIDRATKSVNKENKMLPIDNLVFKTFMKKFNDRYGTSLLKEQRDLISKYVMSFVDNGLDLKIFLNEEIDRLKEKISEALVLKEFVEDYRMKSSAEKVLQKIDSFKTIQLNRDIIADILKIQQLVCEIHTNGD